MAATAETLAAAARIVREGKKIVCFSGAGLSAPSGVGTFRDPGDGWWSRHDPMKLASPEGFAEDPDLVMKWYAARRRQMAEADPNAAHLALAHRPDLIQITQNTDDLLDRAGCTDIIRLHGSINGDRCHANCGHVEMIDMHDPPGHRSCPCCGAAGMRPTVVWFGEALPAGAWSEAEDAARNCDVFIVVGTSAVVYPAAGLIAAAGHSGATIIVVNRDPSGASEIAHLELLGSADEILPEILAEG
ncbi:MAG: NAD-dependent deacylase [Phycisphaerae bacterium]|nr:NAD-dependent deacylase [Phycisphaerae bacterium]|tara:strand:- start:1478 stop:2212 length:735 start_codon:yes stop_codon:yes gene_type:complete